MFESPPLAPTSIDVPVSEGTDVVLDPTVRFHGDRLISGGSPWRLLRLSRSSRELVASWRSGGVVRAHEGSLARTLVNRGFLHPSYPALPEIDDVDVVIPVKDDVEALSRLLSALDGLPVTVIDDGSRDAQAVASVVRERSATLIRVDDNQGPAAARNIGVMATRRPFICFIDADVIMRDASTTLARLRSHFNDPLVGAVGARVRGQNGTSARERFESSFGPLDLGASTALVTPHAPVAYVPAACLMTRRAAIGSGFDESLRHGEDVDLVWRLSDSGWLVVHDATAEVQHPARRSWRRWATQRVGYGRSAAELKSRHPEHLETVRVDAWTLGTWVAMLTGHPRIAFAVMASARRSLIAQLPEVTDDPGTVADQIVVAGIARAGLPLARALTRSYAPVLIAAAFVPRLRRPALIILGAGTFARLRRRRGFDLREVPLSLADDLAYSTGLFIGAAQTRRWDVLAPRVTGSTAGLRAAIGRTQSRSPRR